MDSASKRLGVPDDNVAEAGGADAHGGDVQEGMDPSATADTAEHESQHLRDLDPANRQEFEDAFQAWLKAMGLDTMMTAGAVLTLCRDAEEFDSWPSSLAEWGQALKDYRESLEKALRPVFMEVRAYEAGKATAEKIEREAKARSEGAR